MARDLKRDRPDSIIKSKLQLYLANDMLFNNPPGYNAKSYRAGTKCEKVIYNSYILRYLNNMEDHPNSKYVSGKTRAVAVSLDGMVRYMWRDDVLTEAEYAKKVELDRRRISLLRQKQRGNVDSGKD